MRARSIAPAPNCPTESLTHQTGDRSSHTVAPPPCPHGRGVQGAAPVAYVGTSAQGNRRGIPRLALLRAVRRLSASFPIPPARPLATAVGSHVRLHSALCPLCLLLSPASHGVTWGLSLVLRLRRCSRRAAGVPCSTLGVRRCGQGQGWSIKAGVVQSVVHVLRPVMPLSACPLHVPSALCVPCA